MTDGSQDGDARSREPAPRRAARAPQATHRPRRTPRLRRPRDRAPVRRPPPRRAAPARRLGRSSPAMNERYASADAATSHARRARRLCARRTSDRLRRGPRGSRGPAERAQTRGRQGDVGPSSSAARSAFSNPAPTSPHGNTARSVARLDSSELKPSGSGPSSSYPAARRPRSRRPPPPAFAGQRDIHASTRRRRVFPHELARKPSSQPRTVLCRPTQRSRSTSQRSARPPPRTRRRRARGRSPRRATVVAMPGVGPAMERRREPGSRCSSSTRRSWAKRRWKRNHSSRSSSGTRKRLDRESSSAARASPPVRAPRRRTGRSGAPRPRSEA